MMDRLLHATKRMGLVLNKELSCADLRPDGRVQITAAVDTFPVSEDERRLVQSAVHCVILDEFREVNPWALDVQVIVPIPLDDGDRAPPTDHVVHPTRRASQWIGEQADAVQRWARIAAVSLFQGSADRILSTYPWRDADAMRARIPILIDALSRVIVDDLKDPTHLALGYVDQFLPPLKGVVKAADIEAVLRDATATNGGTRPVSVLEVYELAYEAVVSGTRALAPATINLYYALFLSAQ